VIGQLPAGIGGGSQVASKIELPSIHLPCLAACQATCLASKFRKVDGQTGQLTCSNLLVHLPCLSTGLVQTGPYRLSSCTNGSRPISTIDGNSCAEYTSRCSDTEIIVANIVNCLSDISI